MKYFKILLPILMVFVGVVSLKDYFSRQANEKMDMYAKLAKEGKEVVGELDEGYIENKSKMKNSSTFDIHYTYHLEGVTYSGEETVSTRPEGKDIKVTYLPENPEIHTVINPLELTRKYGEEAKSPFNLYIGLLFLVVGMGLAYFRYVKYFKK